MALWKRGVAAAVLAAMVLSLLGCMESKPNKRPTLNYDMPGQTVSVNLSPTDSEQLSLSEQGAAAVLETVYAQQAEYPYAHLYELEQVKSRLNFDATVTQHRYSAQNAAGVLDVAHFVRLVKENNAAYLESHTFGYKEVEEDYLQQLCRFILTVVGNMQESHPDIDWNRVMCNLGNLKILYNTGMLSYAQVSSEMVLSISKNNTQIVLNLKGNNSFSQVLTHETMHIIQMGCSCEQIENCGRRAGIAVYWDDFTLNTTDWTWLVEGSAERHMCRLTGGPAVSYQYKMDYICSFTMALLLREQVAADTMENLCFYDDPQQLFDAFGCETEQERDEVLKLMITMNILQMQPDSFYQVYEKAYGENPNSSDEAMNRFSYCLKPAVCITLAKEFYENLALFLQDNPMPANDLFCLLRLFEGHLNQHLTYRVEDKAQINEPFFVAYRAMRSRLFAVLQQETGLDVSAMYVQYEISETAGSLNGEFAMLPLQKQDFLRERAQWQSELGALGVKVPDQ